MLSICTSVYKETDSLEVFVRTVFGNASDPSQIEIVVANDGGHVPTTELLKKLSLEFPNLKYFIRRKRNRIKFLTKMVDFYEKNEIFTSEIISDMRDRICKYKTGDLESLWFPAGSLFNQAAHIAKGDVLLFVPGDYVCFADLSKIYEIYKGLPGDVVGHFDWLDITSLDPMPDVLGMTRNFNKQDSKDWLEQAFRNNVSHVWSQHGMRMMTRDVFEKAGRFDGRWFTRAWTDDSLNERAQQHAGIYRLLELDQMKAYNPYFGALRGASYREPEYLTKYYSGLPEIHSEYLSKIYFYLEKES